MTPTAPGDLPATPTAVPISRLSPSQYAVLTGCALRASWTAAREPALLPALPTARLGSVIYALLEEAGRGAFGSGDAAAVGAAWNRLVTVVEERMDSSWLERPLVPLRMSVRDYEVRRIRAERKAIAIAAEADLPQHTPGRAAGCATRTRGSTPLETWVALRDGSIGGYIDRVRETPAGPLLIDYKSGAITEKGDEASIKETYQMQLKLYAALYAKTFGRWPVGLEIVPVEGRGRAVPFTPDECLSLLREACKTLMRVNNAIARASDAATRGQGYRLLANPAPATCGSCPYRPVCGAYHRVRTGFNSGWPVDVWGQVTDIERLGNGKTALTVASSDGMSVRIRSLSGGPDRHPALDHLVVGEDIAAYTLNGRDAPHSFSETPQTVLYRLLAGHARD